MHMEHMHIDIIISIAVLAQRFMMFPPFSDSNFDVCILPHIRASVNRFFNVFFVLLAFLFKLCNLQTVKLQNACALTWL